MQSVLHIRTQTHTHTHTFPSTVSIPIYLSMWYLVCLGGRTNGGAERHSALLCLLSFILKTATGITPHLSQLPVPVLHPSSTTCTSTTPMDTVIHTNTHRNTCICMHACMSVCVYECVCVCVCVCVCMCPRHDGCGPSYCPHGLGCCMSLLTHTCVLITRSNSLRKADIEDLIDALPTCGLTKLDLRYTKLDLSIADLRPHKTRP